VKPAIKLLLSFVFWAFAYGIFSAAAVFVTAIRTCGFTPDSVEICDLTSLTLVKIGLGVGFLAMAAYFYRTRMLEK